jgi:hypothetical protein
MLPLFLALLLAIVSWLLLGLMFPPSATFVSAFFFCLCVLSLQMPTFLPTTTIADSVHMQGDASANNRIPRRTCCPHPAGRLARGARKSPEGLKRSWRRIAYTTCTASRAAERTGCRALKSHRGVAMSRGESRRSRGDHDCPNRQNAASGSEKMLFWMLLILFFMRAVFCCFALLRCVVSCAQGVCRSLVQSLTCSTRNHRHCTTTC